VATYLVASEAIELRSLLRRVLKSVDPRAEIKAAHSPKVLVSMLNERTFDLIVLDDVQGAACLDMSGMAELITEKHTCLLLKKGPRSSLRRRSSPFTHHELQIDDILDENALTQALVSLGGGKSAQSQRGPHAVGHSSQDRRRSVATPGVLSKVNPDVFRPDILILGSSTGGPEALENFFSALKFELAVPVVLVQHTPAGFTRYLVDRIKQKSGFDAAEAVQGMPLEKGKVIVAPGDYHLRLKAYGHQVRCELSQDAFVNSVRPAVDPLFETAADIYGNKISALIFTGMGEDGARGCRAVKAVGGCVGIQSERTCVVFGMPGAVAREGLQDYEGSPQDLAGTIDPDFDKSREKSISSPIF
jgi:chemotaxis response regulator CheB